MLLRSINWQTISSVVGIIGGTLGAITFVMSVVREKSRLKVIQKPDKGYSNFKGRYPGAGHLTVTILISNLSSRQNAVVQYEAEILMKDGSYEPLNVAQGKVVDEDSSVEPEHCVTPLNVAPHSTIESTLLFYGLDRSRYQEPFVVNITVVDMHGNRFAGEAKIEPRR